MTPYLCDPNSKASWVGGTEDQLPLLRTYSTTSETAISVSFDAVARLCKVCFPGHCSHSGIAQHRSKWALNGRSDRISRKTASESWMSAWEAKLRQWQDDLNSCNDRFRDRGEMRPAALPQVRFEPKGDLGDRCSIRRHGREPNLKCECEFSNRLRRSRHSANNNLISPTAEDRP